MQSLYTYSKSSTLAALQVSCSSSISTELISWMMNYNCHATSCVNEVLVFFFKGPEKVLSCNEHISTQQLDYYSIESYNFITCVEDVAIYKERKAMIARGLQMASKLEEDCKKETSAAYACLKALQQRCIETVEKRFEDMRLSIEKREAYVLVELCSLRENLQLFGTAKDKSLTKSAQFACLESTRIPRFIRLAIEDVTDAIASFLMKSWSISPLDMESALKCLDDREIQGEIEDALTLAENQCRKGIREALEYAGSLDLAQFRKTIARFNAELLQYELSSEPLRASWLQRSWNLRYSSQINDAETMAVGLRLSRYLYLYSGKYKEAEQMLRHAYQIRPSEKSELQMQICCELCGVAFHSGQTADTESQCMWFLSEFRGDFYPIEELLTVRFYLASTLWLSDRMEELGSLASSWTQLQHINVQSAVLQLMINSTQAMGECEALLIQAIDIASNNFLTSVLVALAWYLLSYRARNDSRKEECWKESLLYFTAVAPTSIYTGHCLHRLGSHCASAGQWGEAEQHLTAAQRCYEAAAPDSQHVATNLYRIGTMYEEQQKKPLARDAFAAAQKIFAAIGDTKMEETAERSYSRVRRSTNIFKTIFSKNP